MIFFIIDKHFSALGLIMLAYGYFNIDLFGITQVQF